MSALKIIKELNSPNDLLLFEVLTGFNPKKLVQTPKKPCFEVTIKKYADCDYLKKK